MQLLTLTIFAFLSFGLTCQAEDIKEQALASEKTILLDKELSRFEIWLGRPELSVEGLPITENPKAPIGLSNIKNIFSVIEEGGEPVLKITGEIFGGLTTKQSFSNYYFSTKFKWGDKKWEPRLELKRDSGILYHCYGEHGAFHGVWKRCMEYQVQESDLGDFIGLAGPTGEFRAKKLTGKKYKYDPLSSDYMRTGRYSDASEEVDVPHGEWNHLEIYVLGDRAIHIGNGKILMVLENIQTHDGKTLTKGQLQFQSEAAECYYKDMFLQPITAFPEKLVSGIEWKK